MVTAVVIVGMAQAAATAGLSEEYLRALWRTSPMTASQVGYHQDGVDGRLDDLGPEARGRRVAFLKDFGRRLEAARRAPLMPEDAADAELLASAVALERSELEETRDFERRCDRPLDDLGSALFSMAVRPYASEASRLAHLTARLAEVPRYLAQARARLTTHVEVFRAAARDDGEGLLDYLEHGLPRAFPSGGDALAQATAPAARALREHLAFLDKELPKRPPGGFRSGAQAYARRFGPYLQTDRTPEAVLADAERRVLSLHQEMLALARRIIADAQRGAAPAPRPGRPARPVPPAPWAPAATAAPLSDEERAIVRRALDLVAADHPAPGELLSAARAQVDAARAFVRDQRLLTLPAHDNLQVIETPPFLRSVLGVAAFDGAPPLDPGLGAFYYVTPFPPDWSKQKVEEKLREYNRFMLELLTIHEAMPGHYVQFERANEVQPEARRVLRWVLGSTAYVEGWAVYAQDLMVDAGYLGGDPRLHLQQLKLELRAVVNAILDVRLHTTELSDADALALMTTTAFQERPEAEQKLRRAKLSVTQLTAYFVGGEAWRALRRAAEARPGFSPQAFHDRALGLGAVPLTALPRLLLARPW